LVSTGWHLRNIRKRDGDGISIPDTRPRSGESTDVIGFARLHPADNRREIADSFTVTRVLTRNRGILAGTPADTALRNRLRTLLDNLTANGHKTLRQLTDREGDNLGKYVMRCRLLNSNPHLCHTGIQQDFAVGNSICATFRHRHGGAFDPQR